MVDEDTVIYSYREKVWPDIKLAVIKRTNGQLQFSITGSGITLSKEEAERLIRVLVREILLNVI